MQFCAMQFCAMHSRAFLIEVAGFFFAGSQGIGLQIKDCANGITSLGIFYEIRTVKP